MPKEIYLLYSCNEWKEWSSMRLVMASTSERKIRKEIAQQVRSKDMNYGDSLDDIKTEKLSFLNNCLEYGHIEIVEDGERQ